MTLRCMSCGRTAGSGPNGVDTLSFLDREWCRRCARILEIPGYPACVQLPSPGCMSDSEAISALDAWEDCFGRTPKHRIKKSAAKEEIQRAWCMWEGDKSSNYSMLQFFLWLQRFRPYFLTFREKHDPWQTVHSWLIQYERTR